MKKNITDPVVFISKLTSEILSDCAFAVDHLQKKLTEWAPYITREDPCDITDTSARLMLKNYTDLMEALRAVNAASAGSTGQISVGSLFDVETAYEDGAKKTQCYYVLPIDQFPHETLTLLGYTKEKIKFRTSYKVDDISVNLLPKTSRYIGMKLNDRTILHGGPELEERGKDHWVPTGSTIIGADSRISYIYR